MSESYFTRNHIMGKVHTGNVLLGNDDVIEVYLPDTGHFVFKKQNGEWIQSFDKADTKGMFIEVGIALYVRTPEHNRKLYVIIDKHNFPGKEISDKFLEFEGDRKGKYIQIE